MPAAVPDQAGVRAVCCRHPLRAEIMLHLHGFSKRHYVSNSHVVLEAMAPVDGFRWKRYRRAGTPRDPDHDVLAATARAPGQWPTGLPPLHRDQADVARASPRSEP
jgi:hypothetical protein